MKPTLQISSLLGIDLRTRSFFRRDIEKIISRCVADTVLDFRGVIFISRSVADELCNLLDDHPYLTVTGMERDVRMMYEVVVRGRNQPREYPPSNAKVYHLNTFKEMQDFFEAI